MLQSMTLDLILTAEAARIAHVASETIRLWERQGRLSAIKSSRGVRLFDRADVERLARERAVAHAQPLSQREDGDMCLPR
jgi:predicted site-specific integrase-resolvase